MKKILNKKFLVGFLFIFVVGMIFVSSHILKTNATGILDVSMWADSYTIKSGDSTTIHWSSPAGSTCTGDAPGGGNADSFDTGALTETTTYSVDCAKAESCTGTFTIPGFCGPNYQEINCNNLREDNCESLGCIWYGGRWSGDTGYCTNQQYMMCSDMQSENDCNLGGCGWTPSDSGSCSSISSSSTCGATSGCTWE